VWGQKLRQKETRLILRCENYCVKCLNVFKKQFEKIIEESALEKQFDRRCRAAVPPAATSIQFQFNSGFFYSPISQICLSGLYNLYKYDTSDLWPQEKLPTRKTFSGRTKWINLQESNRGGFLSRMDRRIDVMWPEWSIIELHKHNQWIWQYMNSS